MVMARKFFPRTPAWQIGRCSWKLAPERLCASSPRRWTAPGTRRRPATLLNRDSLPVMKLRFLSLGLLQRCAALFPAVMMAGLAPGNALGQAAGTPAVKNGGFVDVTKSSGVAAAIARHYDRHPKWWLSGLNLVDLDGDGQLDLFLAAHGAGRSLALLNDGHGHFKEADGSYPQSEIHLAADINGDGKLDLQMTWQDGGGKWWVNESTPGRLNFRESNITAGRARAKALMDLNRDGNGDWRHERPGVTFVQPI